MVQRSGNGSPPRSVPTTSVASSNVAASVNLSSSDKYTSIAEVGGRLVLYGPVGYPATANTCSSATLSPSTLALTGLVSGSCADPATEGRQVLPVFTVEKSAGSAGAAVPTVAVQISHVAGASPAFEVGPIYVPPLPSPGFRLGPDVMSFPDNSPSWPSWTFGDGYLWLYGPTTDHGSELLRISASTGAVLGRVKMPDIPGPIFAVDEDGLWLAPPANSAGTAVYHVGLTSTAAVRVFPLNGREYAAWMVALGHSVWLAVSSKEAAGPCGSWSETKPHVNPIRRSPPWTTRSSSPGARPPWLVTFRADCGPRWQMRLATSRL